MWCYCYTKSLTPQSGLWILYRILQSIRNDPMVRFLIRINRINDDRWSWISLLILCKTRYFIFSDFPLTIHKNRFVDKFYIYKVDQFVLSRKIFFLIVFIHLCVFLFYLSSLLFPSSKQQVFAINFNRAFGGEIFYPFCSHFFSFPPTPSPSFHKKIIINRSVYTSLLESSLYFMRCLWFYRHLYFQFYESNHENVWFNSMLVSILWWKILELKNKEQVIAEHKNHFVGSNEYLFERELINIDSIRIRSL